MSSRAHRLALCAWLLVLLPVAEARGPKVSSWAYQLQGYDAQTLRGIAVDLLVVDVDEIQRSPVTVGELKQRNRFVVSYLSIGEAESYRAYFEPGWLQDPPQWLDGENPEWKGNFKVRFWDPRWQRLMHEAIRRIAAAGFDGVYLDLVDAYEHYAGRGVPGARDAMVAFVRDLAAEGRRARRGFLVVAQNAAELAAQHEYLETIDGLAKEDTWYYGDRRKSGDDVRWDLEQLGRARDAGKLVLAIDYPTALGPVLDFCREARASGFVPFVGPRDLDRLPAELVSACGDPDGADVAGSL